MLVSSLAHQPSHICWDHLARWSATRRALSLRIDSKSSPSMNSSYSVASLGLSVPRLALWRSSSRRAERVGIRFHISDPLGNFHGETFGDGREQTIERRWH
jgi:hypothetical protein